MRWCFNGCWNKVELVVGFGGVVWDFLLDIVGFGLLVWGMNLV